MGGHREVQSPLLWAGPSLTVAGVIARTFGCARSRVALVLIMDIIMSPSPAQRDTAFMTAVRQPAKLSQPAKHIPLVVESLVTSVQNTLSRLVRRTWSTFSCNSFSLTCLLRRTY
jgi:hypothetical protein